MILFVANSINIILLAFLASKEKKNKKYALKLFTVISFASLLMISGFRGVNIGNDTPMYVRYFNVVDGIKDLAYFDWRFEYFFRVITCITANVCQNSHFFLFVTSLIILLCTYYAFYKYSKRPWYSVLLFVFLMFFYNSMNMIRQYIAIGFGLLAIEKLKQNDTKGYFIYCLVAGLTHTSAFILLILYPLMRFRLNKKRRVLYFCVSTLVGFGFGKLVGIFITLMPKYIGYLSNEKYYLQNKLGTMINIVVWLSFFLVIDYVYKKHSDRSNGEKVDYIAALLGYSITLASINGAVLSRMATYFTPLFCISVPNALCKIPRKKREILSVTILFFAVVYNMVILIFRPEWAGVLPYVFWE